MNIFKISWMLLKNNFKIYKFYFGVLVFAVAIYYNFLAINFNPYLSVLNEQYMYAQTASMLCSIILFFTVVFFMWHANNFFYQLRYKEIGTYMLMGIESSKIGGVFALESIILGFISLLVGIFMGILFSKLFFMLLGKAMILSVKIPFYIPLKAILRLVIIFFIIIFILGIKNYLKVKDSKLIEIINLSKKEQNVPKLKWLRAGLGFIFILIGYVLTFKMTKLDIHFGNLSLGILMLVCIGTYLIFGSLLSIIIDFGIKNKKFIYKESRLISFSNTLFRLETNYRGLAMTAILSAAALTAFSMGLSMKYYADSNVLFEAPYSISYVSQNAEIETNIKKLINDSNHKIISENKSEFVKSEVIYLRDSLKVTEKSFITSYSQIEKALKIIKPKNYEKLLNDIKPKDNEIVKILHSNLIFSAKNYEGNTYKIGGKEYVLKSELKIPFIGELHELGKYETYIISDKEYEIFSKDKKKIILTGINITKPESSKDLVVSISEVMRNPWENMNSYVLQYELKYYLIGSFYFLWLIMAIVFIIATFSTIYFKILSDAILDREQYKILIKIGMSSDEIKKCIYSQVGIAFILPILIGIMHSIVAMSALENFMHYKFTISILTSIVSFIGVMFIFYVFINKKYFSMVYEENSL